MQECQELDGPEFANMKEYWRQVRERRHGVLCHVAGVPCTDWSSMGKRAKWAGKTAKAVFAWAAERRIAATVGDEDVVLVECVCGFDHSMLERLLDDLFALQWLPITPVQMGIPASRRRKYMILLRRKDWRFHGVVHAQSALKVYLNLFGRPCTLNAESLLRAGTEEVANWVQTQAHKQHMPLKRADGRPWSAYLVESVCKRRRIQEYDRLAAEQGREAQLILKHVRMSFT